MSVAQTARWMAALDATWPAAARAMRDGWILRDGAGGGKRVSAATLVTPGADPAMAAAAMTGQGHDALFAIWPDMPGHAELDRALSDAGYATLDPTVIHAAPVTALADGRDETARVFRGDNPVAVMAEIWAAGGIGADRIAVMDRATGPKCFLLGRTGDRPAAAAFVAIDGDTAMIHAIETAPEFRRKGVAEAMIRAAAGFAAEQGAATLGLAVTERNGPARALYAKLSMPALSRYHYRCIPAASRKGPDCIP